MWSDVSIFVKGSITTKKITEEGNKKTLRILQIYVTLKRRSMNNYATLQMSLCKADFFSIGSYGSEKRRYVFLCIYVTSK